MPPRTDDDGEGARVARKRVRPMSKTKTIYLLRDDGKAAVPKPQVFIEVTAAGAIVYGVRVCARSLVEARRLAVQEFKQLRQVAEEMKRGEKKNWRLFDVIWRR